MARRLRNNRLSAEQKEALRKAFVENPNPSSDQRQALADSVGMCVPCPDFSTIAHINFRFPF